MLQEITQIRADSRSATSLDATPAYSRIGSVQYHVTGELVNSSQLEIELELRERFGLEPGSIEQITGVKTRYRAKPGTRPSELAIGASKQALASADINPEELDVIVFTSVAREYFEPSMAHLVQHALGAKNAFVFDIANACLGTMDAVLLLDSLIATGRCKKGLICAGEATEPCYKATIDRMAKVERPEDFFMLFPILTVGDAGAAMIMEPKDQDEPERGIVAFEFMSRGEHHELCVIPAVGEPVMWTDGTRMIDEATPMAAETLGKLLEKSNWSVDDIDLMIPHQVSLPANHKLLRDIGVPAEKCMITVPEFGNTVSTTVPLALAEAAQTGRIEPGSKVLLAGFGSGLSLGFASMIW